MGGGGGDTLPGHLGSGTQTKPRQNRVNIALYPGDT